MRATHVVLGIDLAPSEWFRSGFRSTRNFGSPAHAVTLK